MKTVVTHIPINSSNWTDTNASSTLVLTFIGCYKDFDVTINVSGSHGLKYNVYTGPINEDGFFSSQTGGAFTSGVHAANVHHFPNNNQNWLLILGSATAINSASLINVHVASIREEY